MSKFAWTIEELFDPSLWLSEQEIEINRQIKWKERMQELNRESEKRREKIRKKLKRNKRVKKLFIPFKLIILFFKWYFQAIYYIIKMGFIAIIYIYGNVLIFMFYFNPFGMIYWICDGENLFIKFYRWMSENS